jgi:hypothetical protein
MRRLLVVALALAATPAHAQWTQVPTVPTANFYSITTKGDTIVAGTDSTVYVSVNAGASWTPSATIVAGSTQVNAVRVRNGRIYAGTFRQGVFVSDNLGASWQDFNQWLVGGFANSQLFIKDLLIRADTIYAATAGSGAWIRNLNSGAWSRYGNIFEPAQASNMEGIAGSPTQLLASAGFNGDIYYRDPGRPDWDFAYLQGHDAAGLAALNAVWTGHAWIVGTNIGAYRSVSPAGPWVYTDFGLHPTFFSTFALRGGIVFIHFASGEGTGIEFSTDDGVTWQLLDALPATFVYEIATQVDMLYAGRVDGVWRRSIATVGVPQQRAAGLGFALGGANPTRDEASFRFVLGAAARARIDVFDVTGRLVDKALDEVRPAGPNVARWNARDLRPGMYFARLQVGSEAETVRLVRAR